MRGKVYLVGGGCGPADLMTLRGLRLLRSCEVLVWDDLLAPELAATAPEAMKNPARTAAKNSFTKGAAHFFTPSWA